MQLEQLIDQMRDDSAEQQRLYEEKISELQAEIDRLETEVNAPPHVCVRGVSWVGGRGRDSTFSL